MEQDHDSIVDHVDVETESTTCEWCKFVPNTPTLVNAPSIELNIIFSPITSSGFAYFDIYLQNHDPSSQFRGPPALV